MKRLKFLFLTVFCVTVLFCVATVTVSADVITSGSCGTNVTYTLDDKGTLTISGTGVMNDYDYFSAPWYSRHSQIKTAKIEPGVTSIGAYAFYDCEKLEKVIIPECVTSIGNSAFSNCYRLTEIMIPEGVTSIGDFAFSACNSLEEITIPASVTSIGKGLNAIGLVSITVNKENEYYSSDENGVLFNKDKTKLIRYPAGDKCTTYTIPITVTSICDGAFLDCRSLEEIIIPKGITSIGDATFSYCTSLTEITIPNGVTSIGEEAFKYCINLTEIIIPESITRISDSAFIYCDSLKNIYYTGSEVQWTNIEIGNYNSAIELSANYYHFDYDSSTGKHTLVNTEKVEPTCTKIGYTKGVYCSDCKTYVEGHVEIQLLSHKDSDGDTLCDSCNSSFVIDSGTNNNITWIVLSDGKLTISGTGAMPDYSLSSSAPWYSCREYIKTAEIELGITSIGAYAFYDCSSLTEIAIPKGVTNIEQWAFGLCDSLKKSSLPEGVANIGSYAFYSCSSLTEITIPKNITKIEQYVFAFCSKLKEIVIPTGVASIGTHAFRNCSDLTEITIPKEVASIASYSFYGCSNLRNVYYVGNEEQWTKITIGSYNSEIALSANYFHFDYDSSTGKHTLVNTEKIEPTCTDVGYYSGVYCNECGKYVWGHDEIAATNHTNKMYSIEEIKATCTNVGYTAGVYCIACEKYLSGHIEIEKLPHEDGDNDGLCDSCNNAFMLDSGVDGNIIWSIQSDGKLFISGTGKMTNYISSSAVPWKSFCRNIRSIIIENGVTSVGDYAFFNCSSVTNINIANSVTSIGNSAFFGCSSLTSISIPNSVTSIAQGAFKGCSSLEEIIVPFVGGSKKASTDTFQYPFGYIFGTSSYTGSVSVKQYYYGSSASSTTYSYYYIPTTLTKVTVTGGDILYGAFYGCENIEAVSLADGVASIGSFAFNGCSSLENVSIPNSVTNIGDDAFYYCRSLKKVYITDINKWFDIEFGDYLSNPLSYGAELYLNNEKLTELSIPDSIVKIGKNQLRGCSSLEKIIIPDSVISIEYGAFYNCSSLTNILMSNSIVSVGELAFSGCSSLTNIYIPNSVTCIKKDAFTRCSLLESVYITDISKWLDISFENYASNPLSNGADLFLNNEMLTSLILPDSFTKIGNYQFYNCSSLANVSIHKDVSSIGYCAFYNCSLLKNVYISDIDKWLEINFGDAASSPLSNGADLYLNGEKVSIVTIPDSVTSILYQLRGCSSLTEITIHDGVTSIGDSAFLFCSSLKSVNIPGSVNSIGGSAFRGCTSLTRVIIDDGVASIGWMAFYNCTALTSITIPDSVTAIGSYAFSGCTSLETIWYTGTMENKENIAITPDDNDYLLNATWYYNICQNAHSYSNACDSKCNNCDYVRTDITHENISNVEEIKATCTTIGYTDGVYCNDCKNYISGHTEIAIDADAHKWDNGTITTTATCKVSGVKTYTCQHDATHKKTDDLGINASNHVNIKNVAEVNATCSTVGYTTGVYCNDCQKYISGYEEIAIDANAHNWDNGTITTTATCKVSGVKTYTCQHNASHKKTENLGVNASNHVNTKNVAEVKATCTTKGSTAGVYCNDCAKYISGHVEIPVDADAHKWDNGTITTTATCKVSGVKTYTCQHNASHKKTENLGVNASNHVNTKNVAEVKATCTTKGSTAGVYCNDCAKYISGHVEIPVDADAHKWDNGTITTTATCKVSGVKTCTCQHDATHKKTENLGVNASNHVNTKNTEAVASTCSTVGYTAGVWCNDCEKYISGHAEITIDANAHNWDNGTITTTATCKVSGVKTYICQHNSEHTKTVNLGVNISNHVNTKNVAEVKATCSTKGYTAGVYCNDCAKYISGHVEIPVDADAHKWDNGTITTTATCKVNGAKTYICQHNSEHTKTVNLGVNISNHVNTKNVAEVKATCSTKGYTAGVYCNDCAKYISGHVEIPVDADAHKWDNGTITTTATCKVNGAKTYICQHNSEHTKTVNLGVNISNHVNTKNVAEVKATCSTKGYTAGVYCNDCAKYISGHVEIPVDADAHKWDNGTITTTATCKVNGAKTYICQHNSEHTKTVNLGVNISNHVNTKNVAEVKATCSTKGYTAGVYCNDCAKYISGHVEIPVDADAHKWDNGTITTTATCKVSGVKTYTCQHDATHKKTDDLGINASNHVNTKNIEAITPTCSEIGYTAGVYCNDCQKYISGHKEIPVNANAHKWDNGTITTTATCKVSGVKTYTCQHNASHKKTEKLGINASNHINTKNVAEVKTTCTTKGSTAGVYCNDCQKYISGHAEIAINPANHMNTKNVPETPATFENVGYTAGVYCNDCKKYISGHAEIPKLVATFTDSKDAKESGNNIVSNNGLTVAQLLSQAGKGAVIKTADGKSVENAALIGTGMVLTMADGSKKEIVVYGDADGDGDISSADARLALRASVGLENYKEDSCYYKAANVESNDKISAGDARLILRASVGLEDPKAWLK